jgi:hypothetical protein
MPKLEGHRRLRVRYGTCSRCQQCRLTVASAAQDGAGNPAAPLTDDFVGDEFA